MKHLHEKNEQYAMPHKSILDTFPAPGHIAVTLTQKEFTSLCPLTSQPDYAEVVISYVSNELCVESKSLKLYLSAFRQVGAFAETITHNIFNDLLDILDPLSLSVTTHFVSRGGISIVAKEES